MTNLKKLHNAFMYRIKKYYYKYFESILELRSKYRKSFGLNSGQRDKHIIISLTSYYKRFDVLHLTLETLLSQSYKPDKIIVWLSQKDIDIKPIPIKIKRLESRGIEIQIVDENILSYKKLIYSLKEFPNSYIVTCDDDILYPSFFLKGLVSTSETFSKCIVAYTCRMLKLVNSDTFESYNEGEYVSWVGPSLNLLPIGASGILYPPHALNEEVYNQDVFLKLAPTADDLWFKAMALLNNVPTVLVSNKSSTFFPSRGSQESALNHVNVLENKNDEQLKNIFDHYSLYSKLV